MSALTWDNTGEKVFEVGVDRGVLYVMEGTTYKSGVAWNGLTAVSEKPSGAEANKSYADNIEYANVLSAEEYAATIEAFASPPEFDACDGYATIATGVRAGQQARAKFGFCYRTKIGNDTEGENHGYQIHIVYGAQASPSERNHQTINESPELMTLSWEISTTPVPVPGFKPTASLVIDSTIVSAANMKKLEDKLYGTNAEGESSTATEPTLPSPAEIIALVGTTQVSG